MKRAKSYRTTSLVVGLVVAGGIAVLAACSNQGEGERCNSLAGNEDCNTDDGLACYPAAQLKDTVSDRCCPLDRTQATHPVCLTQVGIGSQDASAPADTGPATSNEASVNDGATEASSNPGSDAGADAADAADGG